MPALAILAVGAAGKTMRLCTAFAAVSAFQPSKTVIATQSMLDNAAI
jgi:hypothetical protein